MRRSDRAVEARSGGAHRGSCAGWPASPWPTVADEQRESARLEVSESSTSLPGESYSDATDADASMLANHPHSRTAWAITKWKRVVLRSGDSLTSPDQSSSVCAV
jgi:hypothetical protein